MNVKSRIERLEERHTPKNPFEHLTDEELDRAIDECRKRIEAHAGMPETEYINVLENQLAAGTLPPEEDEKLVRRYIAAIRRESAASSEASNRGLFGPRSA